jgi:phospholipase C
VRTAYERHGTQLTGDVEVQLHNKSTEPVSLAIKDNSYPSDTVTRQIKPGQETSVVLRLKRSQGWYDFTVKADGSNQEAHYAGRVETGVPGFSDPLMGGVLLAT